MNTMLSFKMDDGRFNFRVSGVILHNDKILLVTNEGLDFWYVPGGRI